MTQFSIESFQAAVKKVTSTIGGHPLNEALEAKLAQEFSPDSDAVKAIQASCMAGIEAGEVCQYEAGGIKYGRVIDPSAELDGFSVDVVHMSEVVGPHHRHPQGEIDLIMPITEGARFDGMGAGWLVYGPDSAHKPTVRGGEALVLYLLPNGEIEFTR